MKEILLFIMIVGLCFSTISVFLLGTKAAGPDPVGYWRFDEGSGTVANDSTGNGNTGTLINDPQWVNGRIGMALEFNGMNSYVSVPHSSSISISGDQISVEYWMKLSTDWHAEAVPPNIYDEAIFDKEDSYYNAMAKDTGTLMFNLYVSGGQIVQKTNKNSWDAGVWYHIANVYNSTHMMNYVNGVLDKIQPLTGSIRSSSRNLSIGSYCERSPHHFFHGTIDEFKIYDYGRTADDIERDAAISSIVLTPSAGFASTTVVGSGFSNNTGVTIRWDETIIPSVPYNLSTDATGKFAALVSVPTQTAPGVHTLDATDEDGKWATATFTVVNMTGPQGPSGPQGTKGDTGDIGAQGPPGSSGETQLILIAFPTAASVVALCIGVVALLRRRS